MKKKDSKHSPQNSTSPRRSIEDRDLNEDEQRRIVNTKKDEIQKRKSKKSKRYTDRKTKD